MKYFTSHTRCGRLLAACFFCIGKGKTRTIVQLKKRGKEYSFKYEEALDYFQAVLSDIITSVCTLYKAEGETAVYLDKLRGI